MKFDKLCNILIEAKSKTDKFAKLVIGNANPVFTREDIMRDVNDPSRGLMLYLSAKDDARNKREIGSEESIRAGLRRVNWVARTAIRKFKNKEAALGIDKLNTYIGMLLEKYQTRVMGTNVDKANTGYETRIIGNLLLPPTQRNPRGKSVFMIPGMDPNATVEQQHKPVVATVTIKRRDPETAKVTVTQVKKEPVTAVDLVAEFEKNNEYYTSIMDIDLHRAIKKIVARSEEAAPAAEPPPSEAEIGEYDPEEEEYPKEESVQESVSLRDILADPMIKDVYDPKIVKDVVRDLVGIGVLRQGLNGEYTTGEEENTQQYKIRQTARNKPVKNVLPPESEIEDLAGPSEEDIGAIEREEGEDEEDEENTDVGAMSGLARRNLGYGSRRGELSPEGEKEDEEEGEEDIGLMKKFDKDDPATW